jgi:hypothetical protein
VERVTDSAEHPVNRLGGALKLRRDGLHGVAIRVAQTKEFAVLWREPFDAAGQGGGAILDPVCLREQFAGHGRQKLIAENQAVALFSLAPGQHLVEGDRTGPRGEVGAEDKLIEFPPQDEIGFL